MALLEQEASRIADRMLICFFEVVFLLHLNISADLPLHLSTAELS